MIPDDERDNIISMMKEYPDSHVIYDVKPDDGGFMDIIIKLVE